MVKRKAPDNVTPSYKLNMGSTPQSGNTSGFMIQNIEVKRSTRRPLSLEEQGKPQPGMDRDLPPNATLTRSRERQFSKDSGWFEV